MEKTSIIIAICGKSATGKDATLKELKRILKDSKVLISDTTRPPRVGEKNGVDYNFVHINTFLHNKQMRKYLEWAEFKGWYYGTPESQLEEGGTYLGVFNPSGIYQLINKRNVTVIPILLETRLRERLSRMIRREGKWHWEYIRRLWVDFKDFGHFSKFLRMRKYTLILKDYDNPRLRALKIADHVRRLGNFL